MLFKPRMSKALPGRPEQYGAEKNILGDVVKRNLFSSDLTPAEEMRRTAVKFGKWKTAEERKTLSLVFSPDPSDNPTSEQLLDVVNATMDRFFPTLQGVICIHKDKAGTADSMKRNPVMHAHFYGSLIDPTTGKNIHLSTKDLYRIRQWIDQYALEKYGWKPLVRSENRHSHNRYRATVISALQRRGSYSWRADMAERIENHYRAASSYQDFISRLDMDGIDVFSRRRDHRSGKILDLPELCFSFGYRGRTMAVRASSISEKLGYDGLMKRFPELGGTYGQVRGRYTFKDQGPQKGNMGAGTHGSTDSGRAGGGQEQTGRNGGKIDYGCVFCEHDREICRDCIRNRERQGGHHERGGRTR